MKEYPITFKPEMVRAIIDGKKTQTRRLIKNRNSLIDGFQLGQKYWNDLVWMNAWSDEMDQPPIWLPDQSEGLVRIDPRIDVGDQLWVRESHAVERSGVIYRADCMDEVHDWISSIFMKKKYARIYLEVKNVRWQRIKNIVVNDVFAEGYPGQSPTSKMSEGKMYKCCEAAMSWMRETWDRINKKHSKLWSDNPHVWIYDFDVKKIWVNVKWV